MNDIEDFVTDLSSYLIFIGDYNLSESRNIAQRYIQTLLVSGTPSSEFKQSALNYAQSLVSGIVHWDEFKSILETNPFFIMILCKYTGMDEERLKECVRDFKLDTGALVNAITCNQTLIQERWNQL